MSVTATWHLGQETHKILKGAHHPMVPQRWTISVIAEAGNFRQRWTIRPSRKVTLDLLHELVSEEIAQFRKENGDLQHLSWVAHSR